MYRSIDPRSIVEAVERLRCRIEERFPGSGLKAGLDAGEVEKLLAGDAYAAEVRLDEREAQQLGVNGVPFFRIGTRYGVTGAQSAEVLVHALERAWSELAAPLEELGAERASCGPDGCD